MSTAETLREVRELLAVPERWSPKDGAWGRTGRRCYARSPRVVKWGLLGALFAVFTDWKNSVEFGNTVDLLQKEAGSTVIAFNNTPGRTHDEVIAFLDRAIARAEQEQKEQSQ